MMSSMKRENGKTQIYWSRIFGFCFSFDVEQKRRREKLQNPNKIQLMQTHAHSQLFVAKLLLLLLLAASVCTFLVGKQIDSSDHKINAMQNCERVQFRCPSVLIVFILYAIVVNYRLMCCALSCNV